MTEPFAVWTERDLVRASGPDAVSYLQGQLSQDVDALAPGASAWSLLLQPSGKVDAWLRITRTADDTFELDVDGGWGDHVRARLTRFKLRTKCELEPVVSWRCLAVRGTTVDAPSARPIVWPGTTGVDLLGPEASVAPPDGVALRDEADLERARIEAGVPAMGRELTDATIPGEGGSWFIDASVSFTKGCYTGQELVARVDSRGGNVPRPVRGLRIDGPAATGAEVVTADGRVAGTVTSAAMVDATSTVALAPLLRTVEPGARVTVASHGAAVVELPMA